MTERLYYTDPYLRSFDAIVQRVDRSSADGRLTVVLDRSAFYPTSGGQPFDTGTLDGLPVVEVADAPDGSVAHIIDAAGSGDPHAAGLVEGRSVRGEIDWPRRFDHMQQHTGQHVLSAAFDRLFHARTVSVHLGAGSSTIDLGRETSADEIAAAEAEANRVVWEDRPVSIRFATKEETAALPLRKESAREGTLRLIDVEGFDLSACGGTHVARTGAIGIIAVASWERFKSGQRLEFLAGGRALDRFRSLRDVVSAGTRLLSVLPRELPEAIQRALDDAKGQKRAFAGAQAELSRYRADELAAAAEPIASGRLVCRAVDADAAGLKLLASAIVARPGHVAVLVSTSSPAFVIVARSVDAAVDAREILAKLAAAFGGRGGGSAEVAQGGGFRAAADAILKTARALIEGQQ
jgi:alanyl-tRNA synthetase